MRVNQGLEILSKSSASKWQYQDLNQLLSYHKICAYTLSYTAITN